MSLASLIRRFFSPPASLGTCCDGIIGNDFLNQFPVEFQAESPAEVRVWPKRDFHLSPETPWVQISSGPNGELVSQCSVEAFKGERGGEGVDKTSDPPRGTLGLRLAGGVNDSFPVVERIGKK